MSDLEKAVSRRNDSDVDNHERRDSVITDSTADSEPSCPGHTGGKDETPDIGTAIDHVASATIGEPSGKTCDAALRRLPLSRNQSRVSSLRSRPLSIVPRAKRRGILGRLSVVPEVDNPYDYANSTKWQITATVALATAGAPMGSSIFYRRFILFLGGSGFLPASMHLTRHSRSGRPHS